MQLQQTAPTHHNTLPHTVAMSISVGNEYLHKALHCQYTYKQGHWVSLCVEVIT